jgi:hypothetical protein
VRLTKNILFPLITNIYYGLGYHLLIHNISDSLHDLKRGIIRLLISPFILSPVLFCLSDYSTKEDLLC